MCGHPEPAGAPALHEQPPDAARVQVLAHPGQVHRRAGVHHRGDVPDPWLDSGSTETLGNNVDAYVNTLAGAIFMGAGLASMAFLRTSYNYLGFTIWNVIFSFVVGMILFAAGLYGRVSE